MRNLCAAAVLVLVGSGPAFALDAKDMAAVTLGFYSAYATFHPSDGIPDAKDRAKYEPFISPALDALLKQGADAEEKFAKANKDSPPLIEGDLFTSNFEGANAFTIGSCKGDSNAGHCAVSLTYDPGKTNNPKDKPITWTDTVYLVATPQGWRVNDIAYGGSWDFGNKGKLSDTLRSVTSDAGL